MQTLPSRSFSINMPYHSMEPVPREHRRAYERVRMELQDASVTARQTLQRADRWDRDWTSDLDPSPQRVHRTSDTYGEHRSIEVETQDDPGQYARPSKMIEEKVGKHKTTAFFENGEVVRLEQKLHGHDGGVEDMVIEVNPDHTVTYTIHETGEFALQPMSYELSSGPSGSGSGGGSGPDGVYDEWDNSNRGGGPDSVYDEYDNGRGYYFDGPDGRTSYDPYH
jgi:hypothetical protein